jgi:hypothetical protein
MFLHAKQSRSVRQILLAMAIGLAMVAIALLVLSCRTPPPGLRFVKNAQGETITGTVRVLCYTSPAPSDLLTDVIRETKDGVPTPGLPAGCNYVAALHLKHEQPSGRPNHGPAYWVYATSWEPGATTPLPAAGDIIITDTWPLVLFNVVASLAWEPAPDSKIMSEIQEGLLHGSEYLYDLTEGQMAFGPVTIDTGGCNWDSADLRFLPANDYRPSAYVGGMVEGRIPDTTAITSTVYFPAATFYGRYWDGEKASEHITGTWALTDAYRTIIHEWAHYALFLYDEYQKTAGGTTYCICDDLSNATLTAGVCGVSGSDGYTATLAASAMAYHYTASELWSRAVHNAPQTCLTTHQWEMHGQSDWETLENWYPLQGLSGDLGLPSLNHPNSLTGLNPGPSLGLVGDLFGRWPDSRAHSPIVQACGAAPSSASEPTIWVQIEGGPQSEGPLLTQVYLLDRADPETPIRILHQGKVISMTSSTPGGLGGITLLGHKKDDRIRIFVDLPAADGVPGGRFVYPQTPTEDHELHDGDVVVARSDKWQASLDAQYQMSGSLRTAMTVIVTETSGITPSAQLCAMDASIGCHPFWRVAEMNLEQQLGDKRIWTATFTPLNNRDELPLYGVVRVQAPEVGELIRWFQAAGGVPPAHEGGDAPLRDGLVMVDATTPVGGEGNQVMVMPAANYEAQISYLPVSTEENSTTLLHAQAVTARPVRGFVAMPLDLDILQPPTSPSVCRTGNLSIPVRVTLFYNEDTIDQLSKAYPRFSEANDLRILHFNPTSPLEEKEGAWSVVPISDNNTALNWLATEPVCEDGIYVISYVQ